MLLNIFLLISFIYFLFYNYSSHIFNFILYMYGFKIDKKNCKNLPSKLILISSHTSMYDFFIGMAINYAIFHKNHTNYVLMKKVFADMCNPFLPFIDKKFKLIEVNSNKKGITQNLIENLKSKNNYIIYLSPEGTRKINKELRKGYWALSNELDIKVMYIGIDFSKKYIFFEKPRYVDMEWENEKKNFVESCKKYLPLYPERCYWTKDFYDNQKLSSSSDE